MARWLEGIEEAAFKLIPGGYVFQSPNPWLFARPRYYLVNDAQKAALADCLRRRVRLAIPLMVLGFVLTGAVIFWLKQLGWNSFFVTALAAATLLTATLIIPHAYLMTMLRPVVRDLPKSDQRFTMALQFSNTARATPSWLLWIGIAGALVMVFATIMSGFELMSEGRLAARWMSQTLNLAFGIIGAIYFGRLLRLRKKSAPSS